MANQHYDLIVIGSGPAGQKGAIDVAKLGKRVGESAKPAESAVFATNMRQTFWREP